MSELPTPVSTRPAWARVDLNALAANLDLVRRRVAPAGVLAILKADAYGHGALAIARELESLGVEWLGVALPEEGVELRRAGARARILVLGTFQPRQVELFARFDLVPTVSSRGQLALWRERGQGLPFHLKVDTGMSRLGVPAAEVAEALAETRRVPALRLAGLCSHLAESEDLTSGANERQESAFAEILALLSPEERARAVVHLANSAAALHRPASRHRLVRCGLALYGIDPARAERGLAPVLSLGARIVQTRSVEEGTGVGYGGRWKAGAPARLAVVPLGYGDGYPWRLGGRAEALVGGRRVPVVGAVSMDMLSLDVSGLEVEEGSEVVLLGRQGEEEITAAELASRAGTIPYEILTRISPRVPRRYTRGAVEDAPG